MNPPTRPGGRPRHASVWRKQEWHHLLLLLPAILAGAPALAGAQSLHGWVLRQGDTLAVSGADLLLEDSAGLMVAHTQSDEAGEFRLAAPAPGRFLLRVTRLGYAPLRSPITLEGKETVEVELRMAEEAIPLEPMVVVGRRRIRQGTLDEFYDRMARMKQMGRGQFLTREQIESRLSMRLPILLQTIPGVWLSPSGESVRLLASGAGGGPFCTPEFYLDGRPMLGGYRDIETMDLEGVEVYRGYWESVPGYFPSRCGIVFLWRKPNWGNPFSFGRLVLAVGLVSVGWLAAILIF